MNILKWLLSWTRSESSSGRFALILVDDSSDKRHYRWISLNEFQKALKKDNVGVSREFPPALFKDASKISWIRECPAHGCAHNVFKIHLKRELRFCHLRSKVSLGQIIRGCQQQVFDKEDHIDWYKVQTIKFVPVGSRFLYENKLYVLSEMDDKLYVEQCID